MVTVPHRVLVSIRYFEIKAGMVNFDCVSPFFFFFLIWSYVTSKIEVLIGLVKQE